MNIPCVFQFISVDFRSILALETEYEQTIFGKGNVQLKWSDNILYFSFLMMDLDMYFCIQLQGHLDRFSGDCFVDFAAVQKFFKQFGESELNGKSRIAFISIWKLLLFYGHIMVPSHSVFEEADMDSRKAAVCLYHSAVCFRDHCEHLKPQSRFTV